MIAAAQQPRSQLRTVLAGLMLCGALLGAAPAQAHLMAAQKGTLNIVGDAAFMVLSVPVSALQGVDDDGDGALSKPELQAHTEAIRAQVQAGVQLLAANSALPLQLMMVDAAPPEKTPDSAPEAAANHLTVLGRFQLPQAGGGPAGAPGSSPADGLTLRFALFGTKAGEQQQDLTITRQQDIQQDSQWLRFTPERPAHALLPRPAAVLAEYIQTGMAHVLGGPDHLLFLLVVLSAGWGWRAVLAALSCFTVGHALSLAGCAWAAWSAPAAVVEPAIAATIVGMAAFDAWSRRRAQLPSPALRLALVFACALIHGLGLAGALGELTQWAPGSPQLLWALAGFNLGIEAGQLAVAALAGVVVMGLGRVLAPAARRRALKLALAGAMAAGSFWFVQRAALGG